MNYGSFRGILNYKRAEPFESLKNLTDLRNEHHHHPIMWAKTFAFGALMGAVFGYSWFVLRPFQSFPIRKLLQASGDRPWSGRQLRWVRNVVGPYMLVGGSLTLSYRLIIDFLRHHEESNNDRPMLFDHTFALSLISATVFGMYGGMPRYWFTGAFVGATLLAPMSWWIYRHGRFNAQHRSSNIYYENGLSKEELERIQQLDAIESLGATMLTQPAYGYFIGDQRHI